MKHHCILLITVLLPSGQVTSKQVIHTKEAEVMVEVFQKRASASRKWQNNNWPYLSSSASANVKSSWFVFVNVSLMFKHLFVNTLNSRLIYSFLKSMIFLMYIYMFCAILILHLLQVLYIQASTETENSLDPVFSQYGSLPKERFSKLKRGPFIN